MVEDNTLRANPQQNVFLGSFIGSEPFNYQCLSNCYKLQFYPFCGQRIFIVILISMSRADSVHSSQLNKKIRTFNEADIPNMLEKIFSQFDQDKNHRFTRAEFPKVVSSIINMVGGETPTFDDVEDLFNLLDVNGDETIDRKEFTSLLTTFFKILREENIKVQVQQESDIIF